MESWEKKLSAYVEEAFRDQRQHPCAEEGKQQMLDALRDSYEAYRKQGVPEEQALVQAKEEYGTQAGIERTLFLLSQRQRYESFRRKYPILVRIGLIGILAVTALALLSAGTTESKLTALTWWIVCIIGLVAFVMIVECVDYQYHKRLEGGKDQK